MYLKKLYAALFGVVVVAALARPASAGAQSTSDADRVTTSPVSVRVVNYNPMDVRVFAVTAGRVRRLGTVSSFTSAKFKLPPVLLLSTNDLRLVASPVGSKERFSSPPLTTLPGDVIEWRLEGNLALSSVRFRAG